VIGQAGAGGKVVRPPGGQGVAALQ